MAYALSFVIGAFNKRLLNWELGTGIATGNADDDLSPASSQFAYSLLLLYLYFADSARLTGAEETINNTSATIRLSSKWSLKQLSLFILMA